MNRFSLLQPLVQRIVDRYWREFIMAATISGIVVATLIEQTLT